MNELAIKMNVFAQAAGRFILWFAGFIGLMLVCNVASAAEGDCSSVRHALYLMPEQKIHRRR